MKCGQIHSGGFVLQQLSREGEMSAGQTRMKQSRSVTNANRRFQLSRVLRKAKNRCHFPPPGQETALEIWQTWKLWHDEMAASETLTVSVQVWKLQHDNITVSDA